MTLFTFKIYQIKNYINFTNVDNKVELHNPNSLFVLLDLPSDTEIRTECSACCRTVAHLSMSPPGFIFTVIFMAIQPKKLDCLFNFQLKNGPAF